MAERVTVGSHTNRHLMRSKRKSAGIVSWPEAERPRERLLRIGPQALGDAELVAILLRVGTKGTNAVELARRLLQQCGSLRGMAEMPVSSLLSIKGLKGAKAAQLAAAIELARRIALPDKRTRPIIKGTLQAARYLQEFRCHNTISIAAAPSVT